MGVTLSKGQSSLVIDLAVSNNIGLILDNNKIDCLTLYYNTNPLPEGYKDGLTGFHPYSSVDFGKKVYDIFTNPAISVPVIIDKCCVQIRQPLFKRSEMEKKLIDCIASTGCELSEWNILKTSILQTHRDLKQF